MFEGIEIMIKDRVVYVKDFVKNYVYKWELEFFKFNLKYSFWLGKK